jgi:hypothetical protein
MEKKWLLTAQEAQRRLRIGPFEREPWLGRTWPGPARPGRSRPSKGRLARIHEIARDLNIQGSTLRNYLIALEGLQHLPDQWLVERLSGQSAVGVAAFCRWFARDPYRARSFLKTRPNASLQQLLAAERESRTLWKVHGRRSSVVLNDELIRRLSIGQALTAALGRKESLPIGEPARLLSGTIPQRYRFAGLDQLIVPKSTVELEEVTDAALIGIIDLPRLELLDSYSRRAREIWWRSLSASTVCPLVILLFPGPAARRRFLGALPLSAVGSGEPFGAVPNSPRAGSGATSRPILFRCQAGAGLLLVTTRLSLPLDIGR